MHVCPVVSPWLRPYDMEAADEDSSGMLDEAELTFVVRSINPMLIQY